MYNSILDAGVFEYKAGESPIYSLEYKTGNRVPRELPDLYAHVKQNLLKQLKYNIKTLSSLKKTGKTVGKLRYRSRVNTIEYSTGDVKLRGNKILIPKIGRVHASGLAQLRNHELANARLTRRAGSYYLLVTCFEKQVTSARQSSGMIVGVDMGVASHVTLSTGETWDSMIKESERLKSLQRKLSRQIKGSNNYVKTRVKIQREHARMNNLKKEQAVRLATSLLDKYDYVFIQDENLRGWSARFGKSLQHSSLGTVKAKLSQSSRVIVLDRFEPTTQYCPQCKVKTKHALGERVFSCACGYSMDRDVHAARNMIILGQNALPPEQRGTLVESALDVVSPTGLTTLRSMKQATLMASDLDAFEAAGSSAQM